MVKGVLEYGRYDEDPEHIGCPRAMSAMTPCVARDGTTATTLNTNGAFEQCVGCGRDVAGLFAELVHKVTAPAFLNDEVPCSHPRCVRVTETMTENVGGFPTGNTVGVHVHLDSDAELMDALLKCNAAINVQMNETRDRIARS